MQRSAFDLEIHTFQIDFLGHVNNCVHVKWMEIGRTKLLEAAGLFTCEILNQRWYVPPESSSKCAREPRRMTKG